MTSQPVSTEPAEFQVRVIDNWPRELSESSLGVYHHPAWQAAVAVYGLELMGLVAERENQPCALLALARQSSRLFGKRLVSLPWVDESGAVGDPAAVAKLLDHAVELGRTLGADAEILLKQPINHVAVGDDPIGDGDWKLAAGDKVLMRRRLDCDADTLWKALSAKVRNQVRKAEKSGLSTERGGSELVPEFFEVYARNMRDLGSPSHSLKFFKTLVEQLGDLAAVYCTRYEGVTVGAGIVLDNRPALDIPWASSLREYNRMCVNHGMYWRIISDACTAGYEWFHFGRSSAGSGQYKFKKQWGAEETPLNWLVYAPNEPAPNEPAPNEPASNDSPKSSAPTSELREKFGLAQQVWTRLPLGLSKRLGPLIIRNVP